jgi:flagellar export protein FliJ
MRWEVVMADPLETLLRLRRMALDEARRTLADCLREESEATADIRALDDAIDRETNAATDLEADDAAVEAFATWFKRVRQDRASAAEVLSRAETRTQEARAVLTVGQRAARVVEDMLSAQETERREAEAHRDQLAIDEAAGLLSSGEPRGHA